MCDTLFYSKWNEINFLVVPCQGSPINCRSTYPETTSMHRVVHSARWSTSQASSPPRTRARSMSPSCQVFK